MMNNKQTHSQHLPLHSGSAQRSVSGLLPSLRQTIDVNTRNIDKSKSLITLTIFAIDLINNRF